MLKDGDLLLVVDPKDNQAYHCVRINVDQQGKVTYTSGNGEAINGKLNWMKNEACYIIPTQEITQKNAQKHYECMSNEKLLEMAQAKGMFAKQTPIMQTTNAAAQTDERNQETVDIYTIMRSDFNRFKNYMQRMSELQNPEKTVVAQTTNSVSKATPYHRFVRPQSQYG